MEATADNSISGIRLYPAADVITVPRFDGRTLPANQPLGYFSSEAPVGHSAIGEPIYDWELPVWRNTGVTINKDTWLEAQALRQKLFEQSCRIADRLEPLTGESSYRDTLTRVELDETRNPEDWRSAEHTAFRNLNMIPCVARTKRNELCADLRAFLDQVGRDQNMVARYFVVTGGPRCGSTEIDARRARLRRAISELGRELPALGLHLVFRTDECPADPNKPTNEKFHPHSNIIFIHKAGKRLDFKAINETINRVLGSHWRDCGVLKDVRECIKYTTKGDEIEAMDDETFREYVHYYMGAHLIQSYGWFADFRRDLRENREKYRAVIDRNGDFQTVRVKKARRIQVPGSRPASGAFVVGVTSPIPSFEPVLRPCVLIHGKFERSQIASIVAACPVAMRALEIMCERVPESFAGRSPDRSHLHQNSTGASVSPSPEPPPRPAWGDWSPDKPPDVGENTIPY